MTTNPIKVGGVPEHFNYVWKLSKEKDLFKKYNVNVEWNDVPLGTGAMIKGLKEGEFDIIIALTEGLVAEIAKGSDIKLFGTYVRSPLCWAVICGKDSQINTIEDLKGKTFGISRYTSGSHIMVCVMAIERSWHPQNDVSFVEKGNFKNLRDSVNDGSSSAFLWEHFTTKPFKDSGEVKFVGDITTPWPCFMLAAKKEFLQKNHDTVKNLLSALQEGCKIFSEDQNMSNIIAENYGLKPEDAKQWYKQVEITASPSISESSIQRALESLYQAKILSSKNYQVSDFIDPKIATLEKDIRAMKLYSKPELIKFIHNNLNQIGKSTGDIKYTDVLPFDQHHYHGIEALEVCKDKISIDKDSQIINIGSGLGGVARYYAGKYGSKVLPIELQDELHRTASEITSRCGLNEQVHHLCGDFLQVGQHFKENYYTHIVSWLTVLHIPERDGLYSLCFKLLKPGGIYYAEDFFKKSQFTEGENKKLREDVYCPYLPDLTTYKQQLTSAGFEIVEMEDLTNDWKNATVKRVEQWEEKKDSLLETHREDTYNRLLSFYKIIRDIFAGGNLGGVRVICRKPNKNQ